MSTLAAAPAFFAELRENNGREFFTANRQRYEDAVRTPFLALLDRVGGGTDGWRVYRPNRDTRFSRDPAPYKTFLGAIRPLDDGTGYYLMVDERGVLVASGLPEFAPDQRDRYRAAVADDRAGSEFERIITRMAEDGRRVTPGRYPPLTGTPRGYPRDHTRIDLLRWRGVEAPKRLPPEQLADSGALEDAIGDAWREAADLRRWLGRHVGASDIPPEQRYGRGQRTG